MKSVHLVIPDLFLPKEIAAEVCAGLSLPALEKMMSRGHGEILEPVPLENLLCEMFGVPYTADAPIAPISAAFDGLPQRCWLRADPVNLRLQRDQMLLADISPSAEESAELCATLNEYFTGQGMEFFAPHTQRWYVRLDALPRIRTEPLSGVLGRNVRGALPTGEDAARWHQLFNEIQMLLFAHPLNEAREARGEMMINSVWFWGAGGPVGTLQKSYDHASSDDVLVEMFAAAARVPFAALPEKWNEGSGDGRQLLVWSGLRSALQRGDLASWRNALQKFEVGYSQPLWQALRSGKLERLELDIPGAENIRRLSLKRGDTWAFWRRVRGLAEYSLV